MSIAMPAADALTGDPAYPRLKEHVVGSTGLTYYDDKDADLARRFGRRFSSLGVSDCASYLDILHDPLRGASELDALVAEITIGETYFFRHREHFDALRDHILPDLIARNRSSRRLRIWCAGCADGPEPYSLAILLKRDLAHALLGWEITILGTDLNRHSLARAREGRFEEWSFRSTPEDLRLECFSKQDKLWTIAPRYREGVSFQYHNLVDDPFPSLVNNLSAFDLIVCRNVMIYFGPALMRRMIGQFHECLAPGAWLLVGPTEPNMTCFSSFRTVNAVGVTLYQKPDESVSTPGPFQFVALPDPPPTSTAAISPTEQQRCNQSGRCGTPPTAAGKRKHAPPKSSPAAKDRIGCHTLADVRRHADRGEWEDAVRCCQSMLAIDNLNSAVHFHQGLVLEQMRRHEEAERCLRRAIYLDRRSVLPHYYLGLFLQSRGDLRQAARSFENALEILGTEDAAMVFHDADGITAAEIAKLARMHLEVLRERV